MRDVNFKGRAFPSFMISMSFFELLLGFKRVVYILFMIYCFVIIFFFCSKLFDGFFIFILMSLIWLI